MNGKAYVTLIAAIFVTLIWLTGSNAEQWSFSTKEEQDVETIVGEITELKESYTLTDDRYFRFEDKTLITNTIIDRENLEDDVIKLTAVSNNPGDAPIEISVTILDINDNDPSFPSSPLELYLSEGTTDSVKHTLPLAGDKDSGQNGLIETYSIVDGDMSTFQLLYEEISGQSQLYLSVLKSLNRENQVRYDLNISAEDGGVQPRHGYMQLVVIVQDINDNPPIFQQKEYKTSVAEDSQLGSVVATVQANDADFGDNGNISYTITSQAPADRFEINLTSGEIILTDHLDYETHRSYRLEVRATDGGSPAMHTNAFVTIDLENVNDNDPRISFRYFPSSASIASVNEQVAVGTQIALVSVTDPDGITGDVGLEIVDGNDLGYFELIKIPNLMLGKIQVTSNTSLIENAPYDLRVSANDGDPVSPRSSITNMIVVVNSANYHPPVFEKSSYIVTLPELSPVGSIVESVYASDEDSGISGRLIYKIISGNDRGWFAMNKASGLVTTTRELRFEEADNNGTMILRISAQDETSSPLFDYTEMNVTILDENNNPPLFSEDSYTFEVAEGYIGEIGQVVANDKDFGENAEVIFRILRVQDFATAIEQTTTPEELLSYFSLSGYDGKIRNTKALDREMSSSYTLRISASNSNSDLMTSYADVIIAVSDKNDNAPVFYPVDYFVNVKSNAAVNSFVTRIQATDSDNNNVIVYSFGVRSSSLKNYFSLDPMSGVVQVSRPLTGQEGISDIIVICAKDNGDLKSTVNATLSISIFSGNISVAFERKRYKFNVPEHSRSGYVVGRVSVPSSDNVQYFITAGNKGRIFALDSSAGTIAITNSNILDFESESSYNLTVTASVKSVVSASPPIYVTCQCLIDLTDINDNRPKFTNLEKSALEVDTLTYNDTVYFEIGNRRKEIYIYNVRAEDRDYGQNGQVTYVTQSSFPNIRVDDQGSVYVRPDVTSSALSGIIEFDVIGRACDMGSPQLCSILYLHVRLALLEQFASRSLPNVFLNLPENERLNSRVASFETFDRVFSSDVFSNVTVDYSILTTNQPFQIFPNGQVLLVESLSGYVQLDLDVMMRALITNGENEWIRDSILHLHVIDENDHHPKPSIITFNFEIHESASPHSMIGSVVASDADTGIYSSIKFTLASWTPETLRSLFYCDSKSGTIHNKAILDRKRLEKFNSDGTMILDIALTDQYGVNTTESVALSTIAHAKIKIIFSEQNPLHFERTYYRSKLYENSTASVILQVSALDEDYPWIRKQISYIMYDARTGDAEIPFAIDEKSGEIRLKSSGLLDREMVDAFYITLEASYLDGSDVATSLLVIDVLDVKDSPPFFLKSNYSFTISESLRVMSVVGIVEARDGDSMSPSTNLRLELNSDDFQIESISGCIYLLQEVDYEGINEYNITVTVTDEDGQSSSTYVLVFIQDANDNIPVFQGEYEPSLKEGQYDSPVELMTLNATDADSGIFGKIRYYLVTQFPSGGTTSYPSISVNEESGVVTLAGTLDREKMSTIDLVVRAKDSGEPQSERKWSDLEITVNVLDINDNDPKMTNPNTALLPTQSSRISGQRIIKLTAQDEDEGNNGDITFRVLENGQYSDFFNVDDSGYLVLVAPLTFTHLVYPVEIDLKDNGNPPKHTVATVNVVLSNEASSGGPVFQTGQRSFTLSRSAAHVATLYARSNPESSVSYFITKSLSSRTGEPLSPVFTINRQSGVISKTEDDPSEDGYLLEVTAVDESSSTEEPRISKTTITIKVTEGNSNPPMFDSATRRIVVSESATPDFQVLRLKAEDVDKNPTIIYSLKTEEGLPSSSFAVDSSTGEITVTEEGVDRERQSLYELILTANDGVHQSSTEVIISVGDINDNAPNFNSSTLCMKIVENSPKNTLIGRAVADDADLESRIRYSIVNDTYDGLFKVHQLFGIISLDKSSPSIDRETTDLYIIYVRATDEGGLYSDATVFINVEDIDDNLPVFDDTVNDVINIAENVTVGTSILTVIANDVDINENGLVEYSIIGGDSNRHFEIDPFLGTIRSLRELDREEKDTYELVIMASNRDVMEDLGLFSLTTVIVKLLDVNDSPPEILASSVINLEEDSKAGETVANIQTLDLDIGENGQVELSLIKQTPAHSLFVLDASSGNIILQNTHNLDYETTKIYNIVLAAYDKGDPEKSSMMEIIIKITDSNDNFPRFNNFYTRTLSENTLPGTFVIKVEALDIDDGYNGEVVYTISASSNSSYFRINRYTGQIFVANMLDHETATEVSFEVVAEDGGADSKSSIAVVVIKISDVNDCPPVIIPTYSIIHMKENYTPSSPFLMFKTSDCDSGDNGVVDIRSGVPSSPLSDLFSIESTAGGIGRLLLNGELDHEDESQHILMITAADRGSPSLSATAMVLLIVDNVNDNLPVFDQDPYNASVTEYIEPGTLIASIRAEDLDTSVTYTMEDESSVPFYIEPSTGDVFTRQYLDRESEAFFNVTIFATDEKDADNRQNIISVQLYVTVKDINDNAPYFLQREVNIYVNPSDPDKQIFVVEAFDDDEGENGRLSYTMPANAIFTLNANTGSIDILQTLTSSTSFQVTATDNGEDSLSANITINVFFLNKPRPRVSSSDSDDFVRLSEGNSFSNLATFTATSLRDDAGDIVLSLKGDRFDWFSLDSVTGQLNVIKLDYELADKVTLWIEANDSGSPALATYHKFVIEIEDVNDNPPTFNDVVYVGHVREDVTNVIVTVSAVDPDEGEGGVVRYSIVNDLSEEGEKFSIDASNGQIRNLVTLDREIKSRYKLMIRASDLGTPSLYRDVTVYIIIDDVNDSRPVFTRLFSATIAEEAKVGEFVLQVTSNDADEISNHIYELTKDSNGSFTIASNGDITVAKELDREISERHVLEVQSSDDKWKTHTSVTIRVTDVNDNKPQFPTSSCEGAVSKDTLVGTVILQLNATDEDDGIDGKVTYRIPGGHRFFSVDETGQLVTTSRLDCSGCQPFYTFTVMACDSGTPTILCSSCLVDVSVKSVNNHPPSFNLTDSEFALLKSSVIGTKLLTLSATDGDPGTRIEYTILPEENFTYFSIVDANELTLIQNLNGLGIGDFIGITVLATDDGVPANSATAQLLIEITSENLNEPAFPASSHESSPIKEDSSIGKEITTVTANDDDPGLNGRISYVIKSGNIGSTFAINKFSGIITLTEQLDYEDISLYLLAVEAIDHGMQRQSSTVTVRIPVQDVNDRVPQFNSSKFEIRISEMTAPRTVIAMITANDEDTGDNGLVQYSVFPLGILSVRPLTGDIMLDIALDYETQDMLTFDLYAFNEGSSDRGHAQLTVFVTGYNEFMPTFSNEKYEFNWPLSSSAEIGSVNATDEDLGVDGIMEYFLLPSEDSTNFQLDNKTGVLISTRSSNYEVGDIIHLQIGAKNPTSSFQTCDIKIVTVLVNVLSNECRHEPCRNGATCQDSLRAVTCDCFPGFTGKFCETNIDDCASNNPCIHGECTDKVNDFSCSCQPGYTGNTCNTPIDFCETNPCLNGGVCKSNRTGFFCECSFSATGNSCGINSINFSPQSFMIVDAFRSQINFEFSTVMSPALLFFTSESTSSSYLILEIINGTLQLSNNHNNISTKVNWKKPVSDGAWHDLQISVESNQVILRLDNCAPSQDNFCSGALASNIADSFAESTIVGGINNVSLLQTGLFSSHDFVGCIRSLSIDSHEVTLTSSLFIHKSSGITNGCLRTSSSGSCDANTCGTGGICTDLWSDFQCRCTDNKEGKNCENLKVGSTFSGSGYLTLEFTQSYTRDKLLSQYTTTNGNRKKREVEISKYSFEIQFRTRQAEAVLAFFSGVENTFYSTLFIKDNILKYQHKTSNIIEIQIEGNVTDGQIHTSTIEIEKVNTATINIIITLNGQEMSRSAINLVSGVITDFADPLLIKNIYIGGAPRVFSASASTVASLDGCVIDFKLDGISYQLSSDIPNYAVSISSTGSGVSSGCNGDDVCAPNPCTSVEFCKDIWNDFTCLPLAACTAPTPCMNGAICEPIGLENYTCQCAANYTGLNCDVYEPCINVLCNKGEVCIPDSDSGFKCACANGYTESGDTCVLASTAGGTKWWIIFLIVLASIAIVVFAVICTIRIRRKSAAAKVKDKETTNTANFSYEFKERKNRMAPDLLPSDVYIISDEAELKIQGNGNLSSNSTAENTKPLSGGNGVTMKDNRTRNINGQLKSNGTTRIREQPTGQRPASTQPYLSEKRRVPSPAISATLERRSNRVNVNGYQERRNQTLPHKLVIDKRLIEDVGSISSSSSRDNSKMHLVPNSPEFAKKNRAKNRYPDPLQGIMDELSSIVGLTKEEIELLNAEDLRFGKSSRKRSFTDTTSVSTTSMSDLSMQSRTTSSSTRVQTFLRSSSPYKDSLIRDLIPNTMNSSLRTLPQTASSQMQDFIEISADLRPSKFVSNKVKTSAASTTSDGESVEEWNSDSNASSVISTVKKAYSSVSTSNGSGSSSHSKQLDLNFPTTMDGYFSTLMDVFEDISQLPTSEEEASPSKSNSSTRMSSPTPSSLGVPIQETTIWSDIEKLSKSSLDSTKKGSSIIASALTLDPRKKAPKLPSNNSATLTRDKKNHKTIESEAKFV